MQKHDRTCKIFHKHRTDRFMRKLFLLVFMLFSFVSCDRTVNKGENNFDKKIFPIKSSYVGSAFYNGGIALANILNANTDYIAMNSFLGISENEKIQSLSDGSIVLAFLSGPEAYMAYNGHPDYWESHQDIKALFGLFPSVYNGIASDSAIKTLKDLKGKRIALNSGWTVSGDLFLYLLGLNGVNSSNSEIIRVRDTIGISMFKRGNVDFIWYSMGYGHSFFKDSIAKRLDFPAFHIVSCSEKDRLREFLSVYPIFFTEPFVYEEQIFSDSSLVSSSFLGCSGTLDDETAYMVTKLWFENIDYIHQFMDFYDEKNAKVYLLRGLPVPIHPGAKKYLKEAGLIQ